MNRFPRKGDYVRFKNYVGMNVRDNFSGYNNFVNFNTGNVYQILGIEIHAHASNNTGYSHGCVDVVPFSLLIGVNDPSVCAGPVVLNISYENVKNNLEFIPGDNPLAVETLYGR